MPDEPVFDLAEDEVRLWWLRLDDGSVISTHALTDDEHARAQHFRHVRDQHRWTASRAFLREVLGHHLGVPAARVNLATGPHGKPHLVAQSALHFNLAHSGDVVAVAVTTTGEVGVDTEQRRDDIDCIALARTAFGDEEAARLADLPPEQRTGEFFRMWVRHEAVVKCLGTGLAGPRAEPGSRAPWTVDVDLAPDYLAAVAVDVAADRVPLCVTVTAAADLPR